MILINALHSQENSYLEHLDLVVDDPSTRKASQTETPAKLLLQYKTRTYDIIHGGYNILKVSYFCQYEHNCVLILY